MRFNSGFKELIYKKLLLITFGMTYVYIYMQISFMI